MSIVFCANYARTTGRYGKRGEMYAHLEAGHAGQNIYLQSQAFGLATVAVGAFKEAALAADIACSKDETPVYIFPSAEGGKLAGRNYSSVEEFCEICDSPRAIGKGKDNALF